MANHSAGARWAEGASAHRHLLYRDREHMQGEYYIDCRSPGAKCSGTEFDICILYFLRESTSHDVESWTKNA